jgi:endonuclease/exonuclease/phosphatase family metal-dependent hydrolase
MPERISRSAALDLLNATLGIWLGIYAFRTFVPTAVWNLSDALPLNAKGAIAVSVHALGLLAFLPFARRARAVAPFTLALAAIGISRQIFLGNDYIGSALSLVGWIAWLWWLAAFARSIGSRNTTTIVIGFVLAFVFQVGMQAAWQGLDLPMARGSVAIACALVINATFAWAAYTRSSPEQPSGGTNVLLAVGAAFFLELTLFANVGRIGFISEAGLVPAVLLVQAGLLVGLAVISTAHGRAITYGAGLILLAATVAAPQLAGAGVVLLVLGQAALVVLLAHCSAHLTTSTATPLAVGMIVLFGLVFLFYSHYEWPVLWIVAAAILVISALPPRVTPRAAPTFAFAGLAGLLLTAAGGMARPQPNRPTTDGALRVLTYNIRQGFDAVGVPAMQRIAGEIERTNADVIALQEVGRGWTFVGGADIVAYLKSRFPDYEMHFIPVNGQLWGTALLSRLPIREPDGRAFESVAGAFRYGYAAGTMRVDGEDVRVVSVHMTAGLDVDGPDARTDEVEQLLRSVGSAPNAIIAGDLNAHPDEAPVQRIVAAGYLDAGALVGLADIETWPARAPDERIDYVFARGRLEADRGDIRRTTASDHLPVFVRFKKSDDAVRAMMR